MPFDPKYDFREIINVEHFTEIPKAYNENWYIVSSENITNIFKDSNFKFTIFLRKNGEIYGDPLLVKLDSEKKYEFYLYLVNNKNLIENKIKCDFVESNSSLECLFDEWSVSKKGIYNFYIKVVVENIGDGQKTEFKIKNGFQLKFN